MKDKITKTTVRKWINNFSQFVEIFISAIVLTAIGLASIDLILELGFFDGMPLSFEKFDTFLSHAVNLIIGVEFIKMLIKHTPGAAIEVLLFAIAKQLIVGHTTTIETLFGVIAIAVVFATRKFLFIHAFEEAEKYVFSATKKIYKVNHRTMVMIPGEPDQTIGALVRGILEQDEEQVKVGATVSFPNVILRVHRMHDNIIDAIEVIPTGEI